MSRLATQSQSLHGASGTMRLCINRDSNQNGGYCIMALPAVQVHKRVGWTGVIDSHLVPQRVLVIGAKFSKSATAAGRCSIARNSVLREYSCR